MLFLGLNHAPNFPKAVQIHNILQILPSTTHVILQHCLCSHGQSGARICSQLGGPGSVSRQESMPRRRCPPSVPPWTQSYPSQDSEAPRTAASAFLQIVMVWSMHTGGSIISLSTAAFHHDDGKRLQYLPTMFFIERSLAKLLFTHHLPLAAEQTRQP